MILTINCYRLLNFLFSFAFITSLFIFFTILINNNIHLSKNIISLFILTLIFNAYSYFVFFNKKKIQFYVFEYYFLSYYKFLILAIFFGLILHVTSKFQFLDFSNIQNLRHNWIISGKYISPLFRIFSIIGHILCTFNYVLFVFTFIFSSSTSLHKNLYFKISIFSTLIWSIYSLTILSKNILFLQIITLLICFFISLSANSIYLKRLFALFFINILISSLCFSTLYFVKFKSLNLSNNISTSVLDGNERFESFVVKGNYTNLSFYKPDSITSEEHGVFSYFLKYIDHAYVNFDNAVSQGFIHKTHISFQFLINWLDRLFPNNSLTIGFHEFLPIGLGGHSLVGSFVLDFGYPLAVVMLIIAPLAIRYLIAYSNTKMNCLYIISIFFITAYMYFYQPFFVFPNIMAMPIILVNFLLVKIFILFVNKKFKPFITQL